MKTNKDNRFKQINYVLNDLDIARIFNRTGKKPLVRCAGFSVKFNKLQTIGKIINKNVVLIEFMNKPTVIYYSTMTTVKNKNLCTNLAQI